MWPIGGLLTGLSNKLQVPGQNSQELISSPFATSNQTVRAGIIINVGTGVSTANTKEGALSFVKMPYFASDLYTEQNNEWIHDDWKPYVDGSLYEARFVEVVGNTAFLVGNTWYAPSSYGADTGWFTCSTKPFWYMNHVISPSGGFVQWEVTGLIQVREKANHANIVTGDVRFRVQGEGDT